MEIPKSHPRHDSLVKRERLVDFYNKGIVTISGLISQGRGEAFDYLLEEKTQSFALLAEAAALDKMLISSRSVISVNGNTAALAGPEIAEFAKKYKIKVEANLFHWSAERTERIVNMFEDLGLSILGRNQNKNIPGVESSRGKCEEEGIYSADTVLIPLEDGDRAEGLSRMGKFVITIDLNPLSRTTVCGNISIIDDVQRTFANFLKFKNIDFKGKCKGYDNRENISDAMKFIARTLGSIKEWTKE